MAKLLWALCCENAIIDSRTNNLSLINIVEQFNVPKLPVVIPQSYFIVSQWEREAPRNEEENFVFRILVQPESKKDDLSEDGVLVSAKIIAGKGRLRHLCSLKGIPIKETGNLLIIIWVPSRKGIPDGWEIESSIPIEIVQKA